MNAMRLSLAAAFLLLALSACSDPATFNLREVRYASGASLPAERGAVHAMLDPMTDLEVRRVTPQEMAAIGCRGAVGCAVFAPGYCRIAILGSVSADYERVLNHEKMHCAGWRHRLVRDGDGWAFSWTRER